MNLIEMINYYIEIEKEKIIPSEVYFNSVRAVRSS